MTSWTVLEKASLQEMEALQGQKTIFYAHLLNGGERKCPPHLVPTKIYGRAQMQPCIFHPSGELTHIPCTAFSAHTASVEAGSFKNQLYRSMLTLQSFHSM